MRSGRINRRVNIQTQAKTIDDSPSWGDANTRAWTTVKTVSAGIEPLRGQEFLNANAFQSSVTYRVVIRYHAYRTLSTAHRLTYVKDGVTYILNIEQCINKDSARSDWELMCSEGTDKG